MLVSMHAYNAFMTAFLPKGYLVEAMQDKMKNVRNVKPRTKMPPNAESLPTKQQKIQYLPRCPVQPKYLQRKIFLLGRDM